MRGPYAGDTGELKAETDKSEEAGIAYSSLGSFSEGGQWASTRPIGIWGEARGDVVHKRALYLDLASLCLRAFGLRGATPASVITEHAGRVHRSSRLIA